MTTMHHSMTGAHARWAVLWIGKNGWVVKEFEHDMEAGIELYMKVKAAKKRGATLLCRNVGFPPPHNHKKMAIANQRGILWCPYCRQLRRFKTARGYYFENIWIPGDNTQCPVCGITTENPHVMRHNPALNHKQYEEESANGQPGRSTRVTRANTGGARGSSKLTDAQREAKRQRAKRRREAKQGS